MEATPMMKFTTGLIILLAVPVILALLVEYL